MINKLTTRTSDLRIEHAVTDSATHVAFVLLEHFSMASFASATDVLVTANLVYDQPLYRYSTLGLTENVTSDLGIKISADQVIDDQNPAVLETYDVVVICGGLRCELSEHPRLSKALKRAQKRSQLLCGIWNGVVPLAYTGLLDGRRCALHPENHRIMQERFNNVTTTESAWEVDGPVLSCAGPASSLELMLQLVSRIHDKKLARAVREILSCDQVYGEEINSLSLSPENRPLPKVVKDLIQIMKANIDDPLSIEDLCGYFGLSRRRIERLFRTYLDASPSRYYLELRINQGRNLLLQSHYSILEISVACGFLTSSHFSNCFKEFFGCSPSQMRARTRNARAQVAVH